MRLEHSGTRPATLRRPDTWFVAGSASTSEYSCSVIGRGISMEGLGRRGPIPADTRFGHRMRARRMMLGMSQTELGAALGVTFQQIQKYERGINRVSAGTLQKLAATLSVPITYFFDAPPAESDQSRIVERQDGSLRLQEISTLLIQEGNLESLYRRVLDAAINLMSADMGSLQRFYPE